MTADGLTRSATTVLWLKFPVCLKPRSQRDASRMPIAAKQARLPACLRKAFHINGLKQGEVRSETAGISRTASRKCSVMKRRDFSFKRPGKGARTRCAASPRPSPPPACVSVL